jgi:hypothetical protein
MECTAIDDSHRSIRGASMNKEQLLERYEALGDESEGRRE